jgi:hypothetical protein
MEKLLALRIVRLSFSKKLSKNNKLSEKSAVMKNSIQKNRFRSNLELGSLVRMA